MKINIHAGHGPDGKKACGAIGLIKESTEARAVKNEVIRLLKSLGHTVYDCTCDTGANKDDVLKKIVAKCNAHAVDLDVSIHFNSNAQDKQGDGESTGTEVLVYSVNGGAYSYADKICKAIAELGFRNRGVKVDSGLYVLRKTTAPALLVECCFVDDKDDVKLYDAKTMAAAIVKGITGKSVTTLPPATPAKPPKQETITTSFKVHVIVQSLYIRRGPGTNYPTVGAITDRGTYTIVETANNGTWGRLKSGRGWICIKDAYVEKV